VASLVSNLVVACGLSIALLACPGEAAPKAPRSLPVPVVIADAGAATSPSSEHREATDTAWVDVFPKAPRPSVEIALPLGESIHEFFRLSDNTVLVDKSAVYVSGSCPGTDEWSRRSCVSVLFERVHAPPWKTLSEATAAWDKASMSHEDDGTKPGTNLGGGVTPAGAFYAVRSFKVRMGFVGAPGQTVHYYGGVSRVYATLALDDASFVSCTGYIEHEVKTPEDPSLQSVLKVCTSMRPL
jgi:hypothetical protein